MNPPVSPQTMMILQAVKTALDERDALMRDEMGTRIAEAVQKAVQHGDGAALMRGAYGAVLNANLGAMSQALDALEHKRSVVRSGEPSAFLAKVLA